MKWKEYLKLILSALAPVAFIAIKTKYPDFPLASNTFADLLLWAVGLLVGGWTLRGVLARAGIKIAQIKKH